jgi:PAS domain S-box-containing protein
VNVKKLLRTNRSSGLVRYGVAAAVVLTVIALTRIPVIGQGLGPVVFLSIFFSAWYGGIGPGLFATLFLEGIIVGLRWYLGVPSDAKFIQDLILVFFLGACYTVLLELLHVARRRAEASQKWLSAVLSSIGDAVIATDAHGRVLYMNPVAGTLCGWPAAQAAGRPLDEVFRIINEQTRLPVESPAARVLAEGVIVGLANHTVLIGRDGTERPVDDSGAPIRGPDGHVEGVVLVFRDVTERRRVEARLAEEARRKDEFLAMLAHELRNPLAAISNAVQLLVRPDADEFHPWAREVTGRQVRQLTRLVDDLLDVSRISLGKVQLRPQVVDLAMAACSAAEVVRPLIDERGQELRLSIPPGPIELEADPARLEQVIVNLLNNAAKYTEPGGRIDLEVSREPGQAVVRVTDTGIGIGPELLPQIFDLFTQGDRTLTRSEGGLGIGLTMVQKLVEMHGGRVAAQSDGQGCGSTFTVRLPVRPLPAGGTLDGQVAPAPPAPARILLVEDNVDLARAVARLLQLDGYATRIAHDGLEALAAARDFRPDVVLLDIALPGMDGYEVLRRLRHEPSTCHARIIAVTGFGHEEEGQRALDAGFDALLTKPVDHAALTSLLREPGARREAGRSQILEVDPAGTSRDPSVSSFPPGQTQ